MWFMLCYVGSTGKSLASRVDEHTTSYIHENNNSTLTAHLNSENHEIKQAHEIEKDALMRW